MAIANAGLVRNKRDAAANGGLRHLVALRLSLWLRLGVAGSGLINHDFSSALPALFHLPCSPYLPQPSSPRPALNGNAPDQLTPRGTFFRGPLQAEAAQQRGEPTEAIPFSSSSDVVDLRLWLESKGAKLQGVRMTMTEGVRVAQLSAAKVEYNVAQ